jgi:hypothetical protein
LVQSADDEPSDDPLPAAKAQSHAREHADSSEVDDEPQDITAIASPRHDTSTPPANHTMSLDRIATSLASG